MAFTDPIRMRELKRKWRLANREKVLAQKRRYRERHPDRVAATLAKHYRANKAKRLALSRAWALANPDKVKAAGRKCSRKGYAANPSKCIAIVLASRAKRLASESESEKQRRVERERKSQRRWESEHPEKKAEYSARFRKAHPEHKKEEWAKYYPANKEKLAEKQRQYRRKNRHIHLNQKHRRRSRLLAAFVEDCSEKISELRKETNCHWCHLPMIRVTIDHVVPLSRGGKHESCNLVASCPSCNSKKHDKLPNEWIKEAA